MSNGYYGKLYSTFASLRRNKKMHATGGTLLGFSSILKLLDNPDAIDKSVETVKHAQLERPETGKDRLRMMFSYDEFGNMSPELEMVTQGALMGVFTGSMIGGTIHSRENYFKFFEQNQATAFYSQIDAKKRLQDKVITGFFRGAWMWGWRLGLFTGSITFFTTAISVYRGKSSIFEYLSGGAITGALYKFKSGPKAIVAGGAIGALLGTLAGSLSLTIMYLTGTSMEEVRYWQYKWKEEYQEKKLEKLRKLREEDMDPLVRSHEETSTKETNTDLLQAIDAEQRNITPEVIVVEDRQNNNTPEILATPQQTSETSATPSETPETIATPQNQN